MDNVTADMTVALRGEYEGFAGMGMLTRDLDAIKKHFASVWNSGTQGKFQVAGDAGMTLGIPFVAIATESVKAAAKVDEASKRVQATFTVSKQQMGAYTDWIQKNSANLLQSQTSMFQAVGDALSVDKVMPPRTVEAIVSGAAKVSAVFQTQIPDAIKPATIAVRDFHGSVSSTFDTMAKAATKVQGGWSALFGNQTNRILGLASGAGMSLKDTLGAAVTLSGQTGGGRAMSALGSLITSIEALNGGKSSLQHNGLAATIQGLFQKYGGNEKDLSKALGGKNNIALAQLLTGGTASLSGSNGYLNSAFSGVASGLPEQFKKLQLQIEDITIALGKGSIPLVQEFVSIVGPMLTSLATWVDHNKALADSILKWGLVLFGASASLKIVLGLFSLFSGPIGLVIRLGGAILSFGKALYTAFAMVRSFSEAMVALDIVMEANPVGAVVVGVLALAAAFYLAYTRIKPFHEMVNTVMKDMQFAFLHPQQAALDVLKWFAQNWFRLLLDYLEGPFILFNKFILSIFFPNVYSAIESGLNSIRSFLASTWSKLYSDLIKPFQDALSWVLGFGTAFINKLVQGLQAGYSLLPGPMRSLLGFVYSPMKALASWAVGAGKTVAQNIAAGISQGSGAVSSAMNGVMNGASSAQYSSTASMVAGAGYKGPAAPAAVANSFPQVAQYWPQIQAAAKQYGLSPYVLASLMAQESSGNVNAAATRNQYEGVWDYGLYQYGPTEAASVGGFYGPNVPANEQILTAAARLAKVGLLAWNGPGEADTVTARANAWQGNGSAGTGPGSPTYTPQQVPLIPASSIPSLPASALPATPVDHTGQPGWILQPNGTWTHISPPSSNQRYTWTGSAWVLSSTYIAETNYAASNRVAQAQLGAIGATWKGVNVGNLPQSGNHGLNQYWWLQDQYKGDKLRETIADNTAHLEYLRGELGTGAEAMRRLNAIIEANTEAYNAANQAAYAKAHPTAGGAANHVIPVRIDGQCAEVGKQNATRQKIAATGEQIAASGKQTASELAGLRRELQRQTQLLGQLITAVARSVGGLASEDAHFAGVSPVTHGH